MKKYIQLGPIEIIEPREIVYDILKYKSKGSVLDLGSDFGRHALFLASKGFQVTAVEKEDKHISTLKEKAEQLGVAIEIIKSDIVDFVPNKNYDIIIAAMVLHFLTKERASEVIEKMKKFTALNGINAIAVYTNKNPSGLRPYQFEMGELKNLYDGWELLRYEEFLSGTVEIIKDGGPSRRYNGLLVARRSVNT